MLATSRSMMPMPNMISDEVFNDVQNLMLMTKLSEGVDVYGTVSSNANCYVIVNGAPFEYRTFVIVMTAMLRGSGSGVYDPSLWEQIYDVWRAFDYKYVVYTQNHHTTFVRNLMAACAARYDEAKPLGPFGEKERVDFKPMMAEIYSKLTEQ
jgi:hypothetical protein